LQHTKWKKIFQVTTKYTKFLYNIINGLENLFIWNKYKIINFKAFKRYTKIWIFVCKITSGNAGQLRRRCLRKKVVCTPLKKAAEPHQRGANRINPPTCWAIIAYNLWPATLSFVAHKKRWLMW
jgi:hypothetical protein